MYSISPMAGIVIVERIVHYTAESVPSTPIWEVPGRGGITPAQGRLGRGYTEATTHPCPTPELKYHGWGELVNPLPLMGVLTIVVDRVTSPMLGWRWSSTRVFWGRVP